MGIVRDAWENQENGIVNAGQAGSTLVTFTNPHITTPQVFITAVSTSTATSVHSVSSVSSGSFSIYSSAAGTFGWFAVF